MLQKSPLVVPMLAMGGVIALSNVLVQYPLGTWLTYGALTYPFAFLITDLVTRVCGGSGAKRVMLVGFVVGILASVAAAFAALTTLRIAVASATAFLIAQLLDIKLFQRLRHLSWWQTPVISSAVGSVVDTFLFFGIAFSAATYAVAPDVNTWAQEVVPLLGVGREFPLWVSLAMADLGIKLIMILVLLLPYRFFTARSAQ